jgi:hypothetical protein
MDNYLRNKKVFLIFMTGSLFAIIWAGTSTGVSKVTTDRAAINPPIDLRPDWAKNNTQVREGSLYQVVCNGEGPSIEQARKTALASCKISAIDQLQTSAKFKSVTVETETDVGYHSEISDSLTFENLNCVPEKEKVLEDDGIYKVWLKCMFNLDNAEVTNQQENSDIKYNSQSDTVINEKELSQVGGSQNTYRSGRFISSTNKTLLVTTLPACTSLIIRGKRPRVIRCTKNPMTLVIDGTDSDIIVRANGYQPKTIKLSGSPKDNEEVQVILNSY